MQRKLAVGASPKSLQKTRNAVEVRRSSRNFGCSNSCSSSPNLRFTTIFSRRYSVSMLRRFGRWNGQRQGLLGAQKLPRVFKQLLDADALEPSIPIIKCSTQVESETSKCYLRKYSWKVGQTHILTEDVNFDKRRFRMSKRREYFDSRVASSDCCES